MNTPKYKVKIGMGTENTYFVLDYQIIDQEPSRVTLRLAVPEQGSDKVNHVFIMTPATIFIEDVDGWPEEKKPDTVKEEALSKYDGLKNVY
jgi:hypothetical protein